MKANFKATREAAHRLSLCKADVRTNALHYFADQIAAFSNELITASESDVAEHGANLSASSLARLKLDSAKIDQIVKSVRAVAEMADPLDKVQSITVLDDGLELQKITVPLGVFAVIFESRADVAPQILSLALRSGNGVILKGGSESQAINRCFSKITQSISETFPEIPGQWFQIHHDRSIVEALLKATGEIDLIIPRGSNQMVQSIMEKSSVPVLGHADGVCHIFVERSADLDSALKIIVDAKTQYPAACNALETLLVDQPISEALIRLLIKTAEANQIKLSGDEQLRKYIADAPLIEGDAWHTEYGEPQLAIKVVDGIDQAIEHINQYGSQHTDCILSEDEDAISQFLKQVDSANVYANCSTRFADGFRYGFGAEIGISTGRIHARGPVGIEGILSYKYILRGSGHIVKNYVGESAKKFKHLRK